MVKNEGFDEKAQLYLQKLFVLFLEDYFIVIRKPHPFRMEEAFAGIKFLKGHNIPGQGNIVINQQ